MQVIQIGANIIDQYDADSIATDIRFVNNQVSLGPVVDLFGIESLPYIDWIPYVCHRPENYPNHDMIGAWFTFEMWDPHQNAVSITSGSGAPTSFRIRPIQGNAEFTVYQMPGNISPASASFKNVYINLTNSQGYTYPAYVDLDTKSYIKFSRNVNGAPTFSEPTLLQPGFATTTSTNDTCTISGTATTQQGKPGFVEFNFGLFNIPDNGFYGGASSSAGYLNMTTVRYSIQASSTSWPSFEVQVQDPSNNGTWRTYQRFINMRGTDPGRSVPAGNYLFQFLGTKIEMYNADPRTERFGAFGGHGLSDTQWLLDEYVWPGTNAAVSLSGFMGKGPGWQWNRAGYKDFKLQLLSYNNNTFKSVGGWVCYT
jgi:hypothetical protein